MIIIFSTCSFNFSILVKNNLLNLPVPVSVYQIGLLVTQLLYNIVLFIFIQFYCFHFHNWGKHCLFHYFFQDVISILNKHVLPLVKVEKESVLESKGAAKMASKKKR
jgi:hypothetical protein